MRLPDQHLTADELEELGKGERLSGELGDQLRPAREHAASCPACRRRLEVYPTSGAKLEKLRAPQGAQKGPDCPPVEIWLQLAGGLLPSAEQERYASHAATCDFCGPILREILVDFSNKPTEEEQSTLSSLRAVTRTPTSRATAPTEKQNLRVQPEPNRGFSQWFSVHTWQFYAAACVLLGAMTFSLFELDVFRNKRDTVASVNQLLAQAYTEHRTLELRMPGAAYSQMHVQRGRGLGHERQPAPLLEAEAVIARNAAKHQEDPDWLQARARAALLEWNYDDAIKDLDGALTNKPDDPSLLIDKANALFQRAEVLSHQDDKDYGKALDLLVRVLSKKRNDPVALFNSAILAERLTAYVTAIDYWKRYLAVEPGSEWAAEARRHLHELEKKTEEKQKHELQGLEGSIQFLALSTGAISERIEDYLQVAITDWLPQVFPKNNRERADIQYRAVRRLAEVLESEHRDLWLRDIIETKSSPTFAQGIASLADAVRKNSQGDISGALNASQQASHFFESAHSVPGVIRADLERVYALHRAGDGQRCLRAASRLEVLIGAKPYLWVHSNLLLEKVVALHLVGRFAEVHLALITVSHLTQLAGYSNLHLRAIEFQAAAREEEGDRIESWRLNLAGLRQYWTTTASSLRAYNLYADLAFSAESMRWSQVAYLLRKEAVEVNSRTTDSARAFVAHFLLAKAAVAAGLENEGQHEFQMTIELARSFPRNEATEIYQVYSELELVKLKMNSMSPVEAVASLERMRSHLATIASFPLLLEFYQTLGELQLKARNLEGSTSAYASAAVAAKRGLLSLQTERERLAWKKQTEPVFKGIVRLLLEQGKIKEALETWEWYRASSHTQPSVHGSTGIFTEIANASQPSYGVPIDFKVLFRQNKTMLAYAVLPDYIAGWIYDERGIKFVRISPPLDELESTARSFQRQCADPSSDLNALRANARKLYDWLIAPVEKHLDYTRTILIESDGNLNQIPFQALVNPDGNYLGTSYSIVYSPGFWYESFLRKSTSLGTDAHIVVLEGSAISGAEGRTLPSLPDTDLEAKSIAARFHNLMWLRGSESTRDRLSQALSKADIFYFLGHATVGPDKTTLLVSSTIGNAGELDGTDLRTTRMSHLKLAVLAGCSTVAAIDEDTPDLDNLVQVFFEARVPEVIGTRWDIDSSSASALMAMLYAKVVDGQTTGRALQAAIVDTMKAPGTSHPYFWAAFSAYGLN